MKLHFVSFIGLAPNVKKSEQAYGCAEDLRNRQQCLHHSALEHGDVDFVHEWNRERLLETSYYQKNKTLLDQPRGCGYWAWKPYIILQTLRQSQLGDYVIYCDVGKPSEGSDIDHGNLIKTSLRPLVQWADRNNGMFPGVYLSNHGPAKHWIKRDCFQLMKCDTGQYHNMPTVQAGYTVWKNQPSVIKFLENWQKLNTDHRLITDQENTLGLDNYDGFVRHCHDQATLTLLCEKQQVTVFGGRKNQFWGFRNINYIALEAAYQNTAFDKALVLNDLNNENRLLPKYLVRWLELLMLNRRRDPINFAIIGNYSEKQREAWGRFLPNASFDYVSQKGLMSLDKSYDCIFAITLENQTFDNQLLAHVYTALNDEGVMFLAPLPKPISELEKSARTISSQGRFSSADEFIKLNDSLCNPKIPNSRNPVFLSGKNSDSGLLETVLLMVKPTPIAQTNAEKVELV